MYKITAQLQTCVIWVCRDILQLQRASYSETNGFPNYRLFCFFPFIFTLHATACPVVRASRLSGSLYRFFFPFKGLSRVLNTRPLHLKTQVNFSTPSLLLLSSIQSRHTILGRVRFRQRDNTSPSFDQLSQKEMKTTNLT